MKGNARRGEPVIYMLLGVGDCLERGKRPVLIIASLYRMDSNDDCLEH